MAVNVSGPVVPPNSPEPINWGKQISTPRQPNTDWLQYVARPRALPRNSRSRMGRKVIVSEPEVTRGFGAAVT